MNHFDGQGSPSVQYLRSARARTEQFGKLRLRMPTLFNEIDQHVDGVDTRDIDRPVLVLIFLDKRSKNVELVAVVGSGIGIPDAVRFRQPQRRNLLGSGWDGFPWRTPS